MTLQQLKYVTTIANIGSISEAAKRLFVSQPSLTKAIKELEKEMGITIFDRTNKGITVSKEGERFLGYARQVLEQAALLEKEKEQASVKVEKVKEDKKRMSYFEKQEWATIEDEIADLEAKIEEIEAAMLENASDYGQLATLQRDLDAANETLLEKYERYEYLSELEG